MDIKCLFRGKTQILDMLDNLLNRPIIGHLADYFQVTICDLAVHGIEFRLLPIRLNSIGVVDYFRRLFLSD